MLRVNEQWAEELSKAYGFNAQACFHCGTCTALCPVGLDILPRELFRLVLLGAKQRLREASDTLFSCLLCRLCEVHCPRGVRISENIRILRSYLVRHEYGLY